eukprot:7254875-Alexandrium_andersonii.AAC.1
MDVDGGDISARRAARGDAEGQARPEALARGSEAAENVTSGIVAGTVIDVHHSCGEARESDNGERRDGGAIHVPSSEEAG